MGKLKSIKLIIKLTDGTIKQYDKYCSHCSLHDDIKIHNDIELELTQEEFLFLTILIMPKEYITQDIVRICNSLQDKGWEKPQSRRVNIRDKSGYGYRYCEVCKYSNSRCWSIRNYKLKLPKEPFKDIQYNILNINDIEYKLPNSIINAMETVIGIYESCSDKRITIPDYYIPHLPGAIELLLHKKSEYNVAEMSLLDFLGFPIELVKDGFVALDIIIPLESSKEYNKLLLEYGYIVSQSGVQYPPQGYLLPANFPNWLNLDDSQFYPLYMITPKVAELDKLTCDNTYSDEEKDKEHIDELLLLKYLTQKYKKYL
jgi:hypothetical protein